ncbi:lysophospholipid acyltransferase family protein [Cupriavidus metallidurans]|uniref:1-acylglycerol-3-phosphate O-acyltransferase n=1 Tax=Cupriavidus metallidurans (strain ATCC 43123 / DSM 2839 / NBRC 102507 / CH34) TaxID=266264 RepID=Q1LJR5_CUPMC|nr:lysophospholipid acyltransferase family protein [Cupriavidus metallidurans]ABF09611.1 1-acylglycerol-3-phosphate O-acyltransferase [Cupriavidus metallidurans CH34]QGS29546.1 1-acyl-sn-glycerol-3-phosphate acyltransferase [Cupriavidus metallidurans]
MIWLRKARLTFHLLRGVLFCATVFPWASARLRERLIRAWSRKLLAICGIEVEVLGLAPGQAAPKGAMLVSNHISWLDIYVIHSWQPVRFVAKSEIRNWPVVGWLCDKTGTIFIERARKRDAHRVLHHITEVMQQGDLVCVFPEGTTTDGSKVLPFHANLMQAPVAGKLPVQPVGLSYLDAATGKPTLAPAYIDDISLVQCLNAILKSPPIKARLVIGPQLHAASAGRRELAESAREVVTHLVEGAHEAAHGAAEAFHSLPVAATPPVLTSVAAPAAGH